MDFDTWVQNLLRQTQSCCRAGLTVNRTVPRRLVTVSCRSCGEILAAVPDPEAKP